MDYASRASKKAPQGLFSAGLFGGSMLFESTHIENSNFLQTENRQRISTLAVFLWARVDYASRASKKAPAGAFFPAGLFGGSMLFESARIENPNLLQTENRQRISTLAVFLWARVDSNHRS